MALIAMGQGDKTPKWLELMAMLPVEDQSALSDSGKNMWKGENLVTVVGQLKIDYRLEEIKKGELGRAVREVNLSETPIITHCIGRLVHDQGAPMGHWVVIVKRNKKAIGCDTFCVLDSASGKVQDVAIRKEGFGSFEFDDPRNRRWRVVLAGGVAYKFVKKH
jgi:hypothetical protein